MSFGLTTRDGLPPTTLSAFDNFTSSLQGYLDAQHNNDGSHGAVTADSIDLQGAQVGVWFDLPYTASRFQSSAGASVWTVTAANLVYLKAMRIGQLVHVVFQIDASAITVAPTGLFIWLPEFTCLPVGRQAAVSTPYTGGVATWANVAAGTAGLTSVTAYALPPATADGKSRTVLAIDQFGPVNATFANFPVTANLNVIGSCWFPVTPNNDGLTFSFT